MVVSRLLSLIIFKVISTVWIQQQAQITDKFANTFEVETSVLSLKISDVSDGQQLESLRWDLFDLLDKPDFDYMIINQNLK